MNILGCAGEHWLQNHTKNNTHHYILIESQILYKHILVGTRHLQISHTEDVYHISQNTYSISGAFLKNGLGQL